MDAEKVDDSLFDNALQWLSSFYQSLLPLALVSFIVNHDFIS